jgi:hypothetical protein
MHRNYSRLTAAIYLLCACALVYVTIRLVYV